MPSTREAPVEGDNDSSAEKSMSRQKLTDGSGEGTSRQFPEAAVFFSSFSFIHFSVTL